MTVTQLIRMLEEFKDEYGDLTVYTTSHENGFVTEAHFVGYIQHWDGMESDKGCMIDY